MDNQVEQLRKEKEDLEKEFTEKLDKFVNKCEELYCKAGENQINYDISIEKEYMSQHMPPVKKTKIWISVKL